MKISTNIQSETHKQDLEKLRTYLSSRPRDLLLLEFLLQRNSTTREVLEIKVSDLFSCEENKPLPVAAGKNSSGLIITGAIKDAFNQLLMHGEIDNDDLLFKSRKGGKQLTTTSVSRLIRTWLKKTNLTQYKGLPDLRQKLGPLTVEETPETRKNDRSLNALSTVKAASIQQIVYKDLVKNIISGVVSPGQRLFPDKIAKQMSVSTTPVREALSRLEAKGFATHHSKRGWVVSELSKAKLKEILDLRILLECEAIYQAATKITPKTIEQLEIAQHNFEQINEEDNPVESLEANRAFHMLAYQDAGSEMMQDIIGELWDLSSPYYQILFRQSLVPKPTSGINHHIKIVQALRDKNPDEAKGALLEDIVQPADFVFKLFDMYAKSIE